MPCPELRPLSYQLTVSHLPRRELAVAILLKGRTRLIFLHSCDNRIRNLERRASVAPSMTKMSLQISSGEARKVKLD